MLKCTLMTCRAWDMTLPSQILAVEWSRVAHTLRIEWDSYINLQGSQHDHMYCVLLFIIRNHSLGEGLVGVLILLLPYRLPNLAPEFDYD